MKNKSSKQVQKKALRKTDVSSSLRIAVQKLLDAVGKHHPVMAMDTQDVLYFQV